MIYHNIISMHFYNNICECVDAAAAVIFQMQPGRVSQWVIVSWQGV